MLEQELDKKRDSEGPQDLQSVNQLAATPQPLTGATTNDSSEELTIRYKGEIEYRTAREWLTAKKTD